MRVLITNTFLANHTGSELYVRDLALELSRRGHQALVYSPRLGALAEELRMAGVEIVDDLERIAQPPDLIHGQHHLETMAALSHFRNAPAVYFCHGWVPWEEIPPRHPRILQYVCVSARLKDQMTRRHGIPESRVRVILNFVDLLRFRPRPRVPALPRNALALSNQVSDSNASGVLLRACAHHGIRLHVVGLANGNPSPQPELLLPRFDLVFARGRSALEALSVGAAVICCDVEGLGPMVTTENLAALREANLGIQVLEHPLTEKRLRRELRRYEALEVARVTRMVRETAGLSTAVDRILEVYTAVLAEWSTAPHLDPVREQGAAAGYLAFLSKTLRSPSSHLNSAEGRLRVKPDMRTVIVKRLEAKGLRWILRWVLVLARWWRRVVHSAPGEAVPIQRTEEATPGGQAAEGPLLAGVVLSLGSQPTLIGAVQSLMVQSVPLEIVVINSGGGDPGPALAAAGMSVKVINHPKRLLPGAARNLGILATKAPYVAFLAADCLAEEGWAAGKILRHAGGSAAVASAVTNANPHSSCAWASHLLLFSRRLPGVSMRKALRYGVSYDRRLFDRYGLFRDDLRTGEDSEFNDRFSSSIPIAWVPEVRIAHFHPTTLRALLQDQRTRGARMARTLTRLTGTDWRKSVARNALARLPGSFGTAWKACSWSQRAWLLRAGLLLTPASIAYALGALFAHRVREMERPVWPPPRILALLTFHNEMNHLPDYFRNVAPQVDGILALDDGSTDGSGDYVARQSSVVELLRLPARNPHDWNEPRNRKLLVQAAWRHEADWLMVVDADERLECGFWQRAIAEIGHAEREGILALRVRCRELWDSPDRYRCDGVWGEKQPARLFKVRRDHAFDERLFHGYWAPLNSQRNGDYPLADLLLYHLAMLTPEDRRARRDKYLKLDPDHQHQAMGYEYMTELSGLQLAGLEPGREFRTCVPAAGAEGQVRLFALLTFHNEMRYLEGFFRNVGPHVDGIIALDDGSTDGSGAFAARQPGVVELISLPLRSPHVWDQPRNHRLVLEAALRHRPDWIIALDADERLERGFRERALREIAKGERLGIQAFGVVFRELWDAADRYRADGIWGAKSGARLFKAREDHEIDERPHHGHWAPLNSKHKGGFPLADLTIYHLRMIHPADRRRRQERCQRLDPENRWQAIGYDYLTEEAGLELAHLPPGRDYEPLPETGETAP